MLGCFIHHMGRGVAFEAELLAAIMGIEMAHAQGWTRLWLETDSTYVWGLLQQRSLTVPWRFRNRWLSALSLIQDMDFRVSHIYREGNSVADALASLPLEGFWTHTLQDIQDHVVRDISDRPYTRLVQR